MEKRIKLGISSCLLGENVRYDGGHKRDNYLADMLGRLLEWVPVCPETECGLPVPREAMRLVERDGSTRLITIESGIDHTDGMLIWIEKKLKKLEKDNLCGFVFKSRSPSCGVTDAEISSPYGIFTKYGDGIFSGKFMNRLPAIPVEDEERLHEPTVRENFIERVFAYRKRYLAL
ncbi:MAG: DUF523 domain-containing protein [Nitrospirae bacterium]|nr:DUF523 domain-containing protein [Nitrospirota bacterium]